MTFDFKGFVGSSLHTAKIIITTVVPYFLLAELLLYFELMPYIAQFFTPLTDLLNLPPEAALALASGIFLNLYAAIAFAAPLDLSVYSWTVLGLFLGVLHSIPVESAIMKKLGIDWVKSIVFRAVMAFVVLIPLLIIPADLLFDNPELIKQSAYQIAAEKPDSFVNFIFYKFTEAVLLSIEIILLVSFIILITTFIKGLRILNKFDHHLSTAMAVITGLLIGITYGAGVLLKEAKTMSKKQILSVCYFLMVAHAIIEDSLLFVLFGADFVLLVSIRLFFALLVFAFVYRYYKSS